MVPIWLLIFHGHFSLNTFPRGYVRWFYCRSSWMIFTLVANWAAINNMLQLLLCAPLSLNLMLNRPWWLFLSINLNHSLITFSSSVRLFGIRLIKVLYLRTFEWSGYLVCCCDKFAIGRWTSSFFVDTISRWFSSMVLVFFTFCLFVGSLLAFSRLKIRMNLTAFQGQSTSKAWSVRL